jgi:hypothetical protein
MGPKGPPGIVVRFENAGDKESVQSDEDIDENARVIVVRFVEASDGRPVESQGLDSGSRTERR